MDSCCILHDIDLSGRADVDPDLYGPDRAAGCEPSNLLDI